MKLENRNFNKHKQGDVGWGDILLSEIDNFNVGPDKIAVWFLSDSCFAIKYAESIIYTDPYFGGSWPEHNSMRMTSVPLDPALIKKADVILCSHEHADHCHYESLLPFYLNTKAKFIGPAPAAKLMEEWGFDKNRIIEVSEGDIFNCKDLNIYATETNDPGSEGAVTYIIEAGKKTLFFTGDSQYFDGFLKIGNCWNIDIAFINFGNSPQGKQYYMTPSDFLRTARDLKARKAVPMHWDIWTYSYIDPVILNDMQKYEKQKVDITILRMGDRLVYPE